MDRGDEYGGPRLLFFSVCLMYFGGKLTYHIGVCPSNFRRMLGGKLTYDIGVYLPYFRRKSAAVSDVCSPYVRRMFAVCQPIIRRMPAVYSPGWIQMKILGGCISVEARMAVTITGSQFFLGKTAFLTHFSSILD